MGEIAEAVLDGTFCEGCGEVFEDILDGAEPPGYPRRCEACKMEEEDDEMESLGAIALQRNHGIPSAALADLVTQVVGMCGFMHSQGLPQEVILEVFDAMSESGRKALVDLMEEDAAK